MLPVHILNQKMKSPAVKQSAPNIIFMDTVIVDFQGKYICATLVLNLNVQMCASVIQAVDIQQ